jgi:hypothetical protein
VPRRSVSRIFFRERPALNKLFCHNAAFFSKG